MDQTRCCYDLCRRDGWIKKIWYIYTMEYYPAIKRQKKKKTPFAATWKELEIPILSELSQKKRTNHMISLISGI